MSVIIFLLELIVYVKFSDIILTYDNKLLLTFVIFTNTNFKIHLITIVKLFFNIHIKFSSS